MVYRGNIKRQISLFISVFLGLPILFLYNNCGAGPTVQSPADQAQELSSDAFSGVIKSNTERVDKQGFSIGYAFDPGNKSFAIRVYFYVDGPVGQGVSIGSVLASVKGFGASEGHFFNFQIPAAYRDSQTHLLYVYGHEPNPENLLSGAPTAFLVYEPKAENVYNQNLAGVVTNSCGGCHSWNYKSLFYGPLTEPQPHAGGNAFNNQFITEISGGGHGGGRFCNSINDYPCSEIQKWWNAEFN